MPSPNLGLVTTDLEAQDVFDIPATLIPDLLALDQALGGAAADANLLVNPGFELNQRSAASYTGHGTWTLDRWQILYGGGVTLVVSRDGATADATSLFSAKCVFARGPGTLGTLEQPLEDWPLYRGATVTLRLQAWCDQPAALQAFLADDVGDSSRSAAHVGGGGWQALSVTRTLAAAGTALRVGALFTAACTAYLDNATLVLGAAGLPYAPLGHGEDVRRAERYYEVQGGAPGFPYLRGYSAVGAGDVAAIGVPWRARKGGTPVVTKAGTWAVNNAAQPSVPNASTQGYLLQAASLAAGYFDATPADATGLIVAEWNP